MLSPKTQTNLRNAQEYFEEHLSTGDYYSEGQNIAGEWFGQLGASLDLNGGVTRDAFLKLCEGIEPGSGEPLTQRKKTVRRQSDGANGEETVANRRVFYDFTLSPPKSVSIVALIGGDERLRGLHREAVRAAMRELEPFAACQVHAGRAHSERLTGNFLGAAFEHDTSRALDPHLHTHCILFNATWDAVEGRRKALSNYEMLRAQKYVENVYYHELARGLRACGYRIVNRKRGDFEIEGVSESLCQRFSKRHQEIDEKTAAFLAENPGQTLSNVNDLREHIAHKERSRKIKHVAPEQLLRLWLSQLSAEEAATLVSPRHTPSVEDVRVDLAAALRWAEEHLFDRRSVVEEHELWRHALEHARGSAISVDALKATTACADYLRAEQRPSKVTTRETLGRECAVVDLAIAGRGRHEQFVERALVDTALDEEQRRAVLHLLQSRDFVTLFRGGAGTGKSFTLREVVRHLEDQPRRVLAPQRQQVIDLERDGLGSAQTVSEFLTRRDVPPGAVVIVDEAGQIGARQMEQLFQLVHEQGGRLILSGDTRQHGPVEASDALRALERYAGLRAVELTTIRRQDPQHAKDEAERRFVSEYREAVREAARGEVEQSFDRLAHNGAVVSCTAADQHERLAAAYLDAVANGDSTVIVSQTWSEIHAVNDRVRAALQEHGIVGADAQTVTALEKIDLTDAQKRDRRFHSDSSVLVFNRDVAGFRRGQQGSLIEITPRGMVVEANETIRLIPKSRLSTVTVCTERELKLSAGDRLQLKANGAAPDGRRLANGELVTVAKVCPDGLIKLADGRSLPASFRQFVRGYAVTSYGSQGKTVDQVLFSDSAVAAATNAQQWYVTISRGRRGVKIFTRDAAELREHIRRSGGRELAMDLAPHVRRPSRLRRFIRRAQQRLRFLAMTLRHRLGHHARHSSVTP